MTEIKDYPIHFNTEMVRAILEGRKTQTRRLVKPQPNFVQQLRDGRFETSPDGGFDHRIKYIKCPFGKVGFLLWVRETWCPYPEQGTGRIWYRATDEINRNRWKENSKQPKHLFDWRPSIHMPRWASRIMLEITGVRVERLQNIGQGEALKEGCPQFHEPIGWFEVTWDFTTKKYCWLSNPWVWVIEFKRV